MKRYIVIVCLCALLPALLFVGCGSKEKIDETTYVEIDIQDNQAGAATEEMPLPSLEYVPVETKYGELRYQEQWAEFMIAEQTEQGDNVVVAFKANINDTIFDLFEVTIGDNSEDSPVGVITDDAGAEHNVFVRVMELEESAALTEGEQNRLYAMQEDINYVIENLQ